MWKNTKYFTDLSEEDKQNVKTEKGWSAKGFVPVDLSRGVHMCANRNSSRTFLYFHRDDVRPKSEKELIQEKELQSIQNRQKREQKKAEEALKRAADIQHAVTKSISKQYQTLCAAIANSAPVSTVTSGRKIILDTETTGLDSSSGEILQLSIIDAETDAILFDEYFHPFFTEEWPAAEQINHISPAFVADKPFWAEKILEIQKIIDSADTIIGYNIHFDLNFLSSYGILIRIPNENIFDVMTDYAAIHGEYSRYFHDFKNKSLSFCANDLGYKWAEEDKHNSLSDCRATLYCYRKLQMPEYQEQHDKNIARMQNGEYDFYL